MKKKLKIKKKNIFKFQITKQNHQTKIQFFLMENFIKNMHAIINIKAKKILKK